jgi:hypothetical protein
MKDNELIANYKYDKSVRTEAQKVNELRRTNDKSYNAINDAVFQNEYSEYTKANKKDVANKASKAKYTPFFDVKSLHKECENLKGGAFTDTRYNEAGVKITNKQAGPNAETYENCIKNQYSTAPAVSQFSVEAKYNYLKNKENPDYLKNLTDEYNNFLNEDKIKIEAELEKLDKTIALNNLSGTDSTDLKASRSQYVNALSGMKFLKPESLTNEDLIIQTEVNNKINYGAKTFARSRASATTLYEEDRSDLIKLETAKMKADASKKSSNGVVNGGIEVEAPVDFAIAKVDLVASQDEKIKTTSAEIETNLNNKVSMGQITQNEKTIIANGINNGLDFNDPETKKAFSKLEIGLVENISKLSDQVQIRNSISSKAKEDFKKDVVNIFTNLEKNNPSLKGQFEALYKKDSKGNRVLNESALDDLLLNMSNEDLEKLKEVAYTPSNTYTGMIWAVLGSPLRGLIEGWSKSWNSLKNIPKAFGKMSSDTYDLYAFRKDFFKLGNLINTNDRKAYADEIINTYNFTKNGKPITDKNEILKFLFNSKNGAIDYTDTKITFEGTSPMIPSLKSEEKEKRAEVLKDKYEILGIKDLKQYEGDWMIPEGTGVMQTKKYIYNRNTAEEKGGFSTFRVANPVFSASIGNLPEDAISQVVHTPEVGIAEVTLQNDMITGKEKELKAKKITYYSELKKDWVTDVPIWDALKESNNKLIVRANPANLEKSSLTNYFKVPGLQTAGQKDKLLKNYIYNKKDGSVVSKGITIEEMQGNTYRLYLYEDGKLIKNNLTVSADQLDSFEKIPLSDFYKTLDQLLNL